MSANEWHPSTVTLHQRKLIVQARKLGQRYFRPRGSEFDKNNAFPYENYENLRREGFFGLTIPESFGGLGADFETYALVKSDSR